jgi:hypothetical protein
VRATFGYSLACAIESLAHETALLVLFRIWTFKLRFINWTEETGHLKSARFVEEEVKCENSTYFSLFG